MCYNCTCGIPDDDMGHGSAGADPNGKAITEKTFEEASKAFGMGLEATKREVHRMLSEELRVLDSKKEESEKNIYKKTGP
jgi:hypothetical protein